MTAALAPLRAAFDDWRHPRDQRGRFIEVGAKVNVSGEHGNTRRGTVDALTEQGLQVTYADDGTTEVVDPARIEVAPESAAHLDGFDPSAFRTASSPTAVGQALQQHIGQRGTVAGFTDAMDLQRSRDVAETIARLMDKHPDVNASVKIAPLKGDVAQATARKAKNGSPTDLTMVINTPQMMPGAVNDIGRPATSGYFHVHDPGTTDLMTYVVTHEFGHLLDFHSRSGKRAFNATRIRNTEMKRAGITPPTAGGPPSSTPESDAWIAANISRYGQTNYMEMAAEAYADVEVNGDNALPLSKVIHQALLDYQAAGVA